MGGGAQVSDMTAESVAEWLEQEWIDEKPGRNKAAADAIRDLIASEARLRAALDAAVDWMGQSDHTKPAEWVDEAIAALEQKP